MTAHPGLLGFIAEAQEIQQELGVSTKEAYLIQRQRSAEREYETEKAEAETNVIQFRPR